MSQNTNKQHREIKVVVRDFTQQGERDKVRDELIKSGYKVVVKNFTKEESHGAVSYTHLTLPTIA